MLWDCMGNMKVSGRLSAKICVFYVVWERNTVLVNIQSNFDNKNPHETSVSVPWGYE